MNNNVEMSVMEGIFIPFIPSLVEISGLLLASEWYRDSHYDTVSVRLVSERLCGVNMGYAREPYSLLFLSNVKDCMSSCWLGVVYLQSYSVLHGLEYRKEFEGMDCVVVD
jgi:hypothetical protein